MCQLTDFFIGIEPLFSAVGIILEEMCFVLEEEKSVLHRNKLRRDKHNLPMFEIVVPYQWLMTFVINRMETCFKHQKDCNTHLCSLSNMYV